jgi:tryptophan-rich sensory protein
MLTIFRQPHRLSTALCLLGAVAALFLAQLPNDTRSEWFRSLTRPEVLPRELERKIGFIWTAIFLLAGLASAAALAADQPKRWKVAILGLTLLTLALNMTYTYVFTYRHDLTAATWVAAALAGVIAILILVASIRRIWLTALCHLPHLLWVCFATYVTYRIDHLNPVIS